MKAICVLLLPLSLTVLDIEANIPHFVPWHLCLYSGFGTVVCHLLVSRYIFLLLSSPSKLMDPNVAIMPVVTNHLSAVHALQFFIAMQVQHSYNSSTLNFTYSRTKSFRYERQNKNPALTRIELTASALAGVQINY